jgi:hypothetical protein
LAAASTLTDDKDPGVREDALVLLGLLKGRLGDAAVAKIFDGLMPIKKAKIEEACATVKPSKYDTSERKEAKKTVLAKPEVAKKST